MTLDGPGRPRGRRACVPRPSPPSVYRQAPGGPHTTAAKRPGASSAGIRATALLPVRVGWMVCCFLPGPRPCRCIPYLVRVLLRAQGAWDSADEALSRDAARARRPDNKQTHQIHQLQQTNPSETSQHGARTQRKHTGARGDTHTNSEQPSSNSASESEGAEESG